MVFCRLRPVSTLLTVMTGRSDGGGDGLVVGWGAVAGGRRDRDVRCAGGDGLEVGRLAAVSGVEDDGAGADGSNAGRGTGHWETDRRGSGTERAAKEVDIEVTRAEGVGAVGIAGGRREGGGVDGGGLVVVVAEAGWLDRDGKRRRGVSGGSGGDDGITCGEALGVEGSGVGAGDVGEGDGLGADGGDEAEMTALVASVTVKVTVRGELGAVVR